MNNAEIYDKICWTYFDLMRRAEVEGSSMDNVAIFVRSEVKAALDLKDSLSVSFADFRVDVPVVVDDSIAQIGIEGGWKTNILIYSPDWLKAS